MTIFQIVIEGTNESQVQDLFEAIQNNYNLYDNCVMISDVDEENSIVDSRKEEFGILDWDDD